MPSQQQLFRQIQSIIEGIYFLSSFPGVTKTEFLNLTVVFDLSSIKYQQPKYNLSTVDQYKKKKF